MVVRQPPEERGLLDQHTPLPRRWSLTPPAHQPAVAHQPTVPQQPAVVQHPVAAQAGHQIPLQNPNALIAQKRGVIRGVIMNTKYWVLAGITWAWASSALWSMATYKATSTEWVSKTVERILNWGVVNGTQSFASGTLTAISAIKDKVGALISTWDWKQLGSWTTSGNIFDTMKAAVDVGTNIVSNPVDMVLALWGISLFWYFIILRLLLQRYIYKNTVGYFTAKRIEAYSRNWGGTIHP